VGNLAAAVTSDAAIAADPAATAELAERVKQAAAEKPAAPGGSSALAKAVSGKTWRFARNDLRFRSITLRLDDPVPSFEYEADGVPAGAPVARFGGPIGFDGHYRVGGRMRYGLSAARGAWSDDGKSLVLEVQTLGNDDAARLTYVFDGKTVELNFEMALGYKLKLQGRADD
jgi:hypothetical protein